MSNDLVSSSLTKVKKEITYLEKSNSQEINWLAFFMMVIGILIGILDFYSESGFQFIGGGLFGISLCNLLKEKKQ